MIPEYIRIILEWIRQNKGVFAARVAFREKNSNDPVLGKFDSDMI